MKIGQSSHMMYSNDIMNFNESTTIINACKKSLETYWMHYVCIHAWSLRKFMSKNWKEKHYIEIIATLSLKVYKLWLKTPKSMLRVAQKGCFV